MEWHEKRDTQGFGVGEHYCTVGQTRLRIQYRGCRVELHVANDREWKLLGSLRFHPLNCGEAAAKIHALEDYAAYLYEWPAHYDWRMICGMNHAKLEMLGTLRTVRIRFGCELVFMESLTDDGWTEIAWARYVDNEWDRIYNELVTQASHNVASFDAGYSPLQRRNTSAPDSIEL